MHSITVRLLLLAAIAWLAGCSSPSARFYTLSPASRPAGLTSTLSLSVGPVHVPAAVDRPEIVVTSGPNQVRLEEFNRWASPLQDEISRTLAENLVALLGTPLVTQSPPATGADAAYRVAVEVQRFESVPDQAAELDAVWTLHRARDDQTRIGRTRAREPVTQPGFAALAAAHSRLIARLARDIAEAVWALERTAR